MKMASNFMKFHMRFQGTADPPQADRRKEHTKKRTEEPQNVECRMSKEGSKKRTAEPKNIEYRMSKEGYKSEP